MDHLKFKIFKAVKRIFFFIYIAAVAGIIIPLANAQLSLVYRHNTFLQLRRTENSPAVTNRRLFLAN